MKKRGLSFFLALTVFVSVAAGTANTAQAATQGITRQTVSAGSVGYAIKNDGSLWAWGGYDDTHEIEWQLGIGTSEGSLVPVKVMDNVASVSGSSRVLAIKEDGSLWAWGDNDHGQVGNGTTEDQLTPVKILDGVISVATDGSTSYAVKADGSLWGWGFNHYTDNIKFNGNYFSGDMIVSNGEENILTPVKMMDDVKAVSAGRGNVAVIKNDNTSLIWGRQCSTGTGFNGTAAVPQESLKDVRAFSLGAYTTFAIKTDNSLWGSGFYGSNLGLGEADDGVAHDYAVKLMDNVSSVDEGSGTVLATKADGSLWVWGDNGQLGLGKRDFASVDASEIFTPVKIMDQVAYAASGGRTYLALKTDGTLWGWGTGCYGELGSDVYNDINSSVVVNLGINTPVKILDNVALPSTAAATSGQAGSEAFTGWKKQSDGSWYYLKSGHPQTGWQLINNEWYYLSEDPDTYGVLLVNTKTPDGYYVDADGRWIQ